MDLPSCPLRCAYRSVACGYVQKALEQGSQRLPSATQSADKGYGAPPLLRVATGYAQSGMFEVG